MMYQKMILIRIHPDQLKRTNLSSLSGKWKKWFCPKSFKLFKMVSAINIAVWTTVNIYRLSSFHLHNILFSEKFDSSSENKPEYMELFNEYTRLVEYNINVNMIQRIPVRLHVLRYRLDRCGSYNQLFICQSFRMGKFEEMIEERPGTASPLFWLHLRFILIDSQTQTLIRLTVVLYYLCVILTAF